MWTTLLILAGFVIVVVTMRTLTLRQQRAEGVATGDAGGRELGVRVTWPPEYGSHVRARVVRRPEALYLIHDLPDRASALEFLRGCDVRQERLYVIAETSQGNLGKDMIMIFDESDGAMVEMARRTPLASPRRSAGDCVRCGYPVIPMTDPMDGVPASEVGTVSWHLALDEMEGQGTGYRCTDCGALSCAACYLASPAPRKTDDSLDLRCWMPDCGRAVEPYVA